MNRRPVRRSATSRLLLITISIAGLTATSMPAALAAPRPAVDPGSVTVLAAGDIACLPGSAVTAKNCHQQTTSDLLVNMNPDAVLALGDLQYDNATAADFAGSYDPSWGRVYSKTYPAIGNHEYNTPGATGYVGYWASRFATLGAQGGDPTKGYYSYNLGSWHIVVLNSNCSSVAGGKCAKGSAQETWLKADLAANPTACTLAYWHHPTFYDGSKNANMVAIWDDLYAAGAELILAGHQHRYERRAPMTSAGVVDPNGVREIIVGTGGESKGAAISIGGTVEASGSTFGALQLVLGPTSYTWQFMPEVGQTYTDSGTMACHNAGSVPVAPTASFTATPTTGTAPLSVGFTDTSVGNPTSWSWNFGDNTALDTNRNTTHVYTNPGTYTATLTATNTTGSTTATTTITVTTAGGGSTTTTFGSSGDATVASASPTKLYGTAYNTLRGLQGYEYRSYLRFDVSGVTGPVTHAVLRLYVTDATNNVGSWYSVNPAWSEATINWNNAPAITGSPVATVGAAALGTWTEVDVTAAVIANGTASFGLIPGSTDGVIWSSKEGANPPQLVVTYG
jgi:PKD repeat protein